MKLPTVILQTHCYVKPDSPSKCCHWDNVFTDDSNQSLLTPICFPLSYQSHFLHIKNSVILSMHCMTLVSSHPTGFFGPCIDITKGTKMKPIMMGRLQWHNASIHKTWSISVCIWFQGQARYIQLTNRVMKILLRKYTCFDTDCSNINMM